MFVQRRSVYNLVLWVAFSLFVVGCGGAGDGGNSGTPSDVEQSQSDPQVPTITLPDDAQGTAESSTTDESSNE